MKKMRKVEIDTTAEHMVRTMICMHGLWNTNKLSLAIRKKVREALLENPLPKKKKRKVKS